MGLAGPIGLDVVIPNNPEDVLRGPLFEGWTGYGFANKSGSSVSFPFMIKTSVPFIPV